MKSAAVFPIVLMLLVGLSACAPSAPLITAEPDEQWFPAEGDFPAQMLDYNAVYSTNQDIADQAEDPAARLAQLESWGRATGLYHQYRMIWGAECAAADERWTRAFIQVVKYNSIDGVSQALEYYEGLDAEENDTLALVGVGDDGYYFLAGGEDEVNDGGSCSKSYQWRAVTIAFRRANVQAEVWVQADAALVSDDEVLAAGMNLAGALDLRIQALAGK